MSYHEIGRVKLQGCFTIKLTHSQNDFTVSVPMFICVSVFSSLTTASASSDASTTTAVATAASSATSPLTSSSSDSPPARPRQSHKSRLLQFSSNRGFVYILRGNQSDSYKLSYFRTVIIRHSFLLGCDVLQSAIWLLSSGGRVLLNDGVTS